MECEVVGSNPLTISLSLSLTLTMTLTLTLILTLTLTLSLTLTLTEGNDCGALRAAHVGVALSEAEVWP